MATTSTLLVHLVWFTLVASSPVLGNPSPINEDITSAVRDMQDAQYFTFVTLVNMVQDEIPSNITLLMPSDDLLSNVSIPGDQVMEFMSRHSIPAALRLDHLMHLPSGTILPTNQLDSMLTVCNEGKEMFMLNNAKLISPDICGSSSITCHGIDAVLTKSAEKESSCVGGVFVAQGPSPSFRSGAEKMFSLENFMATTTIAYMFLFLAYLSM